MSMNGEKEASTESSSCSTSSISSEEKLNAIKLNVVLTNRGLQIYGSWSKEKLLKLLTHRLEQCVYAKPDVVKQFSPYTVNEKRLHSTVYSGLYSVHVLKELRGKGMTLYTIIKAMKLGLIGLDQSEVHYFKDFKIEPHILELREVWTKTFSDELVLNLRATGLNELQCWDVIVYGVMLQDPRILQHLMLCGIDVPGILKWQSPVHSSSFKVIKFLRHIGVEENYVQIAEQYGIDEELEQMLDDLGLGKMEESSSSTKEVICECSLTILEPVCSCSEVMQKLSKISSCKDSSKSSSTYSNIMDHFELCRCQCHLVAQNKTESELNAQRIDYLRQNIMVPLIWTMARTLRYKPSDPLHFMAYQLLRWIHNNVPQKSKDCVHQVFALSSMVMDRKLTTKKRLEEEERARIQNAEIMKSIPCDVCKERQELHRVKKQCWKCVKKPTRDYESCEFPYLCSSCKVNVSGRSNDPSSIQTLEQAISNQVYD